jgi:DnaJ-class molecular chaperone
LSAGGNGRSEEIEVKIPPGVEDGQRIRVPGRIPGTHGGPPGDLFLRVKVAPHTYFTRRGADLFVELPVSVSEAALGAKIDVPTSAGMATVTLPPGTPSGAKLRLVGHGAPKARKQGHGDLYVVIRVVPPKSLSDEQRQAFEKLRDLEGAGPRESAPWVKRA